MAQIPYEFLVRWDHVTGALKGAHIKTYDSVTNQEGEAQPVAMAGATGFPIASVLTAIEQGAIISMVDAQKALAAFVAAQTAVKPGVVV